MRGLSVVPWIVAVGALTSWSLPVAVGQALTLASRTPRFFYAASSAARPVEIDVSRNAALGQMISLHVAQATIGEVLVDIQRQTGLTFAYSSSLPTRPVRVEAESITVAAALGAVLAGTRMDVVLAPAGHIWLIESGTDAPRVATGRIVGTVTEAQTGNPVAGATVVLEPGRRAATTTAEGRYRLVDVEPGRYTVRARFIGFSSAATTVVVLADQESTADLRLERSAQQLEQLVTIGAVVPTEIKALPTPVSVLDSTDIASRRQQTIQEVFRQAVPSAVGWDWPGTPGQTAFSVRGATR